MKISVPIKNKQTIGSTILFAFLLDLTFFLASVHLFRLNKLVSKTHVANFLN